MIKHPAFRQGTYDTHFYSKHKEELHADLIQASDETLLVAGGTLFQHKEQQKHNSQKGQSTQAQRSNWVTEQRRRGQE